MNRLFWLLSLLALLIPARIQAQTLSIPCTECVWRGTVSGEQGGFRWVGELEFTPDAITNGTKYSFHTLTSGRFRLLDAQKIGAMGRQRALSVSTVLKVGSETAQLSTDADTGNYQLSVLWSVPALRVESGRATPSPLALGGTTNSEARLSENNTRMKGELTSSSNSRFTWDLKLLPKSSAAAVEPPAPTQSQTPPNQIFRGIASGVSLRGVRVSVDLTLIPVATNGNRVQYRAVGTVKPGALPPGERPDCKPELSTPYAFSKDTTLVIDYAKQTYVGLLEVSASGLDRCANKVVPWADEAQYLLTIDPKSPWKDPALTDGNTRLKGSGSVTVKGGRGSLSWNLKAGAASAAEIEKLASAAPAAAPVKAVCTTCTWKGSVTGQTSFGATLLAEIVLSPVKVEGTQVEYRPSGSVRVLKGAKPDFPCTIRYPGAPISLTGEAGQATVDLGLRTYSALVKISVPVQISKCLTQLSSMEQLNADQITFSSFGVSASLEGGGTRFSGKTKTLSWDFQLQKP